MKKALSLVLALTLVLGLGVYALADGNDGYTFVDPSSPGAFGFNFDEDEDYEDYYEDDNYYDDDYNGDEDDNNAGTDYTDGDDNDTDNVDDDTTDDTYVPGAPSAEDIVAFAEMLWGDEVAGIDWAVSEIEPNNVPPSGAGGWQISTDGGATFMPFSWQGPPPDHLTWRTDYASNVFRNVIEWDTSSIQIRWVSPSQHVGYDYHSQAAASNPNEPIIPGGSFGDAAISPPLASIRDGAGTTPPFVSNPPPTLRGPTAGIGTGAGGRHYGPVTTGPVAGQTESAQPATTFVSGDTVAQGSHGFNLGSTTTPPLTGSVTGPTGSVTANARRISPGVVTNPTYGWWAAPNYDFPSPPPRPWLFADSSNPTLSSPDGTPSAVLHAPTVTWYNQDYYTVTGTPDPALLGGWHADLPYPGGEGNLGWIRSVDVDHARYVQWGGWQVGPQRRIWVNGHPYVWTNTGMTSHSWNGTNWVPYTATHFTLTPASHSWNVDGWSWALPGSTGPAPGGGISTGTAAPDNGAMPVNPRWTYQTAITYTINFRQNHTPFIREFTILAEDLALATAHPDVQDLIENAGHLVISQRPQWANMFGGMFYAEHSIHDIRQVAAQYQRAERHVDVRVPIPGLMGDRDLYGGIRFCTGAGNPATGGLNVRDLLPLYSLAPDLTWFRFHRAVINADYFDGDFARVRIYYSLIEESLPPFNQQVRLWLGHPNIIITLNMMLADEVHRIYAGRPNPRDRWTGELTFSGTPEEEARWNSLPPGTVLSISSISNLPTDDQRQATGTIRINSGSGLTRNVTIIVYSMTGTTNIYNAHFVLNHTQPNVPIHVFRLNSHVTVVPCEAVVMGGGQVPNNWRVDGLSASGELRLQRELNNIRTMTGDDYYRIPILPSDFTWRIPNSAIPGQTGTGFQTEQNWEVRASELLSAVATVPNTQETAATLLNVPTALRNVHFERTTLRTTRTVNMRGTIRDVEFHWGGNPHMAIRIRTPEFMARTGTTTVEFDLNMAVTGQSNRMVGRASFDVANNRVYVYENQEFIDPSRREYLRAEDTIRQIDIYAGEGVTFRRNITRGQSVYVQAQMATHDAWDELFRNHTELVDIILVHHAGMEHAASSVRIDRPQTYFVYDSERRLIGTTADGDLPFSPVYFLTTAMIEIGGATLPEDPAGAAPELQDPNVPVTGGDGGASNNVNMNPPTGR
ncbi:MAG: hypothetical protein FWE19_06860 [Oscillospiraceae bacterium]|nr:hypothetical protein [Oscillospiraceae bacterium]